MVDAQTGLVSIAFDNAWALGPSMLYGLQRRFSLIGRTSFCSSRQRTGRTFVLLKAASFGLTEKKPSPNPHIRRSSHTAEEGAKARILGTPGGTFWGLRPGRGWLLGTRKRVCAIFKGQWIVQFIFFQLSFVCTLQSSLCSSQNCIHIRSSAAETIFVIQIRASCFEAPWMLVRFLMAGFLPA